MQQEKHYRKILNIDVYLKKYLSKSEKQYWKKGYEFSTHEYAINELRDIELNYILEHKAELDERLGMNGVL